MVMGRQSSGAAGIATQGTCPLDSTKLQSGPMRGGGRKGPGGRIGLPCPAGVGIWRHPRNVGGCVVACLTSVLGGGCGWAVG